MKKCLIPRQSGLEVQISIQSGGASDIQEKDLFPHYFNDFIFNRCKEQGAFANWTVNYNPFEGGSDHTPFLQAKIPGLLMWHFTDVFYHTDADRLGKVSKETMRNVGGTALASAYTLINANQKTANAVLYEVLASAKLRLSTEFELSKQAIKEGRLLANEQHILETWWHWYDAALETTQDIMYEGERAKFKQQIADERRQLEDIYLSMKLLL